MLLTAALLGFLLLCFVYLASVLFGSLLWQKQNNELRADLRMAQSQMQPSRYVLSELDGLPEPVQRYFRAVLQQEQPLIATASIECAGLFNLSESVEKWVTFTSRQLSVTSRRGFVWDARISLVAGFCIFVHDAYVFGKGLLEAKLFGLFTVMKQSNTPELAQGELMRFFAEGPWYPTALLPSQGVCWSAIDADHAVAELSDGDVTVRLFFEFDAQGLISSVRSDGRFRLVNGQPVLTPWLCRFWDYERCNGVLIPFDAEVSWLMPEGPKPYWRGYIKSIEFG